jgi:AcrR family transcriptional regulator
MFGGVKMHEAPKRPYRSGLRDEQSRETRRRIVAAGSALFVEQGYAATTVDAIAERAGVSRKTVFNAVGGKPALLKLAWDWALVGDDEPVPMADRPEVQAFMAESDPDALVARWARFDVAISARLAPLYPVLQVAADADPDVAALNARSEDNRHGGARALVDLLADLGGLRPGLSRERATEVVATLMDPIPYRRLVHDCGWTFEEYAEHLQRLLSAAIR